MGYASVQQMIDRYGEDELIQLTDRIVPHLNTIDETVLQAALDDADADINGYLQARYTLPLASTPMLVLRLARDIARYYLYDDSMIDTVQERYDQALKTLRDISKGVIHLGLTSSNTTTQNNSTPTTLADAPTFSVATLSGYK